MIRNLAENDDLKKAGKPNLIICLIQEDYDAAKPTREMGAAREPVLRLIGNCATADCLHNANVI